MEKPSPRIEIIEKKRLVGLSRTMSIAKNETGMLWGSFMPIKHQVEAPVSSDLYSIQVYPSDYFKDFSPTKTFEKWACQEVSVDAPVPKGMQSFCLLGGEYAIFDYVGMSSDPSIFQYIYSEWLPQSGYRLDDRPHFEVLGAKYKNNDPNSEEEIWIPVCK